MEMLWQILLQFFATKNCSKVVSHHPDSKDVFIFHFGIERASCAKPQCFDDQISLLGFPLFGTAAAMLSRLNELEIFLELLLQC